MAAINTTLPHVPDLSGVPPNIIREMEALRANNSSLLASVNDLKTQVASLTARVTKLETP